MTQSDITLPFRLVPRKRSQIAPLFGFCLGFVMVGMSALLTANGRMRIKISGEVVTDPTARMLVALLLFAGALVCLGGIVAVAVKMLPRSPFFHINLSSDGIVIRRWFRQQALAWSEAPKLETLEVETKSKRRTRTSHYTVVMQPVTPPAGTTGRGSYLEEVVRISADEYGARSEEEDAAILAEWLDALRKLAAEKRLDGNAPVEVPEAFRSSVRSLAAAGGSNVPKSLTVKRS
jgi:hypothetical protein